MFFHLSHRGVTDMMIELPKDEYSRVQPLFARMEHHLAVQAILSGQTPATVLVDDPVHPHTSLIWNNYRCYLAGASNDHEVSAALQPLVSEVIAPRALAAGAPVLVFYFDPGEWQDRIAALLPHKRVIPALRQYYTLRSHPRDWRTLLPAGYTLRAVDATLLGDAGWRNLDRLEGEMCSERPSVTDFLAHSFGVCLTHDDEIAGWCLSEYNRKDRCEVGIETIEVHQRRGLATVMTLALCERAFANGIVQIGWDCWARNIASAATARKAGFELLCDYPAALAWLIEEDSL